jgi:hypothetical protein
MRLCLTLVLALFVAQALVPTTGSSSEPCAAGCADDASDDRCAPDCSDCVCCPHGGSPPLLLPRGARQCALEPRASFARRDPVRIPSRAPADVFHVPKPSRV